LHSQDHAKESRFSQADKRSLESLAGRMAVTFWAGFCGEGVTPTSSVMVLFFLLAVEKAVALIPPFGYAKETRVNAITFLIYSTSRGSQRA
jgi:hypothetical protein